MADDEPITIRTALDLRPDDALRAFRARELLEAIGEFAIAVKPHHMDAWQRERIRQSLVVLVDHIIAISRAETEEGHADLAEQLKETG